MTTMPTCCGDPWQLWWIVLPVVMALAAAGMVALVAVYDRKQVRPVAWTMAFAVLACWSVCLIFLEW